MFIIFGLGNPGEKYRNTRHNVGSRAIDELNLLNLENVILTKPKTFMNESGKAAKELLRKHQLKSEDLIVIHDDIDIPLGKLRIVKNRGAAGHKGVESIIKELGKNNFIRLRIGICSESGKPKNPEKFVLQKFNQEEEKIMQAVVEKTTEAIRIILKEGLEKAMNNFNK